MSRIRVQDPTGALCETCKYASLVKPIGGNRVYFYCSTFDRYTIPMEECSRHRDRNFVELYDMQKTAWFVDNRKGKDQIGFRSPKDREKDKDEEGSDWYSARDLERLLPEKLKEL